MQDIRTKHRRQRGFTLVEMLVVAPMVILLIGAVIAYITTLTGDSLRAQTQENMTFEIQNALDTMENDAVKATRFLATTGALPSPQGQDNTTTAFTSTDTSIPSLTMGVIATDTNPLNPGRMPVVYANQPNGCNSGKQGDNIMMITKSVYFLRNGSLWKRTIVPSYNVYTSDPAVNDFTVCKAPWQRNSCAPDSTIQSQCKASSNIVNPIAEDEELLQNVTNFSVNYYSTPSSTSAIAASNAPQARTVDISITAQQSVAGNSVSQTGSIRVTRQNDINADLVAPATTPTPACTVNYTTSITCNWNTIANATSYIISYSKNGGSYTSSQTIIGNSFTISDINRNDSITFRVAARNSYGITSNGQTTATVPSTLPCNLQNNWVNYGSPYGAATYTRTSAGVIALSGLIRSGTGTQYEVICNLPPGYRPSYRLIFSPATSGAVQARIDVDTNGDVIYVYGSTGWISLNGINFLAAGPSWTNLTGANGWVPYGSVYAPPQVATDLTGRAFIQGLAKGGTMTSGTTLFGLGSTIGTLANRDIYPAGVSGASVIGAMDIYNVDKSTLYRVGGNGYLSLQAMFYPTSAGTWTTPALSNSWTAYGTGYSTAQYIKNSDGIVSLRGLIKGGTVTSGTALFTLPAAYQPSSSVICSVITNANTFARIDVLGTNTGATAGQVVVREGTNTGWLSLAGCDFMAGA